MPDEADLISYYAGIGQRIKELREKAGKSQEQVSRSIGFASRISVANIESGRQKIQVHTLVQIAQYLKIPLEELLPPLTYLSANRRATLSSEIVKKLDKEGIKKIGNKNLLEFIMNRDSSKTNQ